MSHDFTRVDSANPPDYFNIGFDVVDAAAAGDDRNRLALIWVGDAGQRRTLTYWELSTASNRVTNLLRELGVRGGDRVLLAMPRTPEWWTVALGVIKRGAVLVPLDASFTGAALLDACAAVAPTLPVPRSLSVRLPSRMPRGPSAWRIAPWCTRRRTRRWRPHRRKRRPGGSICRRWPPTAPGYWNISGSTR